MNQIVEINSPNEKSDHHFVCFTVKVCKCKRARSRTQWRSIFLSRKIQLLIDHMIFFQLSLTLSHININLFFSFSFLIHVQLFTLASKRAYRAYIQRIYQPIFHRNKSIPKEIWSIDRPECLLQRVIFNTYPFIFVRLRHIQPIQLLVNGTKENQKAKNRT